MKINEFAQELNQLIEENKKLKQQLEFYKLQLIVILINNGGRIKNLDYPDLMNIDLDKISIFTGMDSCALGICTLYHKLSREKKPIKSWENLPKKLRNP
jgi:hypothetical protein